MFNRRERKYDGNFHCFSAWVTRPRPGTLWLREAAQTYSFNIIPAADRDYLPPQLLPFQFPSILRPVGGWGRGMWPRVHVCSVMRKRGITVRWDRRPAGMDTHFQEAYFSILWQVQKFVFINRFLGLAKWFEAVLNSFILPRQNASFYIFPLPPLDQRPGRVRERGGTGGPGAGWPVPAMARAPAPPTLGPLSLCLSQVSSVCQQSRRINQHPPLLPVSHLQQLGQKT